MIWSYGRQRVDDAYFYQDWCPDGIGTSDDPKWKLNLWGETMENKERGVSRSFNWRDFRGYTNSRTLDEMPLPYDASEDQHAIDREQDYDPNDLEIDTLRHNIMRSYIEVSEWLGEGALQYGSHNGYVSRKMSFAWLFNSIKGLINWKLANQDKWAEKDIHPLDVSEHNERFLQKGEISDCGISYDDSDDIDQLGGRCSELVVKAVRSGKPNVNGVLKVRGNEFHYGERADFYTHNSFIGECRFFHNARFLG